MQPFKQIFAETRQAQGLTSLEAAEYFATLTGRSVSTVYRWLEHCPVQMVAYIQAKLRDTGK